MEPGVVVHVRLALERLGLGGTPLPQLDGEDHEHGHLKELRLPVLERRFAEMRGGDVLRPIDRRQTGVDPLLVVDVQPGCRLADEPHEKERRRQYESESVVANEALHLSNPPRSASAVGYPARSSTIQRSSVPHGTRAHGPTGQPAWPRPPRDPRRRRCQRRSRPTAS